MTKYEAAVISAYTGILLGEFSDLHEYVEKIMDRPVFVYEFASEEFCARIKKKSKDDFMDICKSITE